MKRNWTIALLIALAVAGAMLMGCPSESEEGKTIEGNLVLKGGKYQYVFETPRIEHGKTYEVIFTINDCDEALFDSHMGGKICYKMDLDGEDEKVLSGWQNATPNTISASQKRYVWTFEAGKKYDDSLDPEPDSTTPAGGKQYFALTAQTPSWSDWGANDNFNVDGSFEINIKDIPSDWVSEGTVELGTVDGVPGKGPIPDADVARILALPNNGKITFTAEILASSGASPGWGMGTISSTWGGGFSIPYPAEAGPPPCTYTFDLEISVLKDALGDATTIIINPYNDLTLTKAELFRPGP
jgi:hypothetical protein